MIVQTLKPKVYTIIVTHNGEKWIEKCLQSLLTSEYPVEVIVVDNVSTDRTPQLVENQSNVTLIQQQFNVGFGQANNIGIQLALRKGAERIFLLNQDAWISPGTISKLVHCMDEDSTLGIVSPVHLSGDGAKVDAKFAGYIKEISIDLFYDMSFGQLRSVYYAGFVNAAAWMLSRDCLEKIGGFDPIFFMYGEDLDLYNRVIFHGYKVGLVPDACIYHDRIQEDSQSLKASRFSNKRIHLSTMIMICQIKDPSINLMTSVTRFVYGYTSYSIKSLFTLHFLRYAELTKAFILALGKLPRILKHRRICSQPGRHWLTTQILQL